MTPAKTPIEEYLELLQKLAEQLPFEAEPANYAKAQDEEAP